MVFQSLPCMFISSSFLFVKLFLFFILLEFLNVLSSCTLYSVLCSEIEMEKTSGIEIGSLIPCSTCTVRTTYTYTWCLPKIYFVFPLQFLENLFFTYIRVSHLNGGDVWRMLYLQETLTFQILNIYFEFHKNTKTEIWGTKNFEKRIRFSSKKNSWLYFTVSKNLKIEKNWEELRKSEKRKTRKECFVWRKFGWKIRPFVMLVVERHNSNFKIMSETEEHCYIMGRRNTKNLSTRKITTVVLS